MSFKKKLLIVFKYIVVIPLIIIKKLRHFGPGFSIYLPQNLTKRELLLWKLRVLNPLLNIDVNFRKNRISQVPIDIYIPAAYKDIATLGDVIKHARLNIKHPINKLYVVAPEHPEIVQICIDCNVTYVNESTVLGYNKNNIDYIINRADRSGWLFQQLLKLNSDQVVESENYLVLDADTIFVKPKVFCHKGKYILDVSEERHEPYHKVYENILKRKTTSELSFISHYMLFNKSYIKKLKSEIEIIHGKKWDKAILENVDYLNSSGFSEYELYGNFLAEQHPACIKKEYWFNTSSTSQPPENYIKSISIHSYLSSSLVLKNRLFQTLKLNGL